MAKMKQNWGTGLAIVAVGVLLFLYAGGSRWLPWFNGMARHHQGMMRGITGPYSGLTNPIPDTANSTGQGKKLFADYCSSCHGPDGRGDGPASRDLSPPAANIAQMIRMPIATDAYLFWTLSEGGSQFNTAMPAFKDVLSETERWHLINYLNTL